MLLPLSGREKKVSKLQVYAFSHVLSFFSRPFFPDSPSEVTAVLLACSLQQFLKATVRDPGQENS